MTVCSESKDTFLAEEVLDKLTANMNYTIFKLNSSEYENIELKNKSEIKFDPKYISKIVI